VELAVLG